MHEWHRLLWRSRRTHIQIWCGNGSQPVRSHDLLNAWELTMQKDKHRRCSRAIQPARVCHGNLQLCNLGGQCANKHGCMPMHANIQQGGTCDDITWQSDHGSSSAWDWRTMFPTKWTTFGYGRNEPTETYQGHPREAPRVVLPAPTFNQSWMHPAISCLKHLKTM